MGIYPAQRCIVLVNTVVCAQTRSCCPEICYPHRPTCSRCHSTVWVLPQNDPKLLWVMGYEGVMGYVCKCPAYQLGNSKILWLIREYGLPGVWVKRASTVSSIKPQSSHNQRL